MPADATQSDRSRPHVVIVGGGFGGLYAARALGAAPVRITLVDRRNHHLFQPMLYQVATAALSPANIAAPIRRVLRRQKNTSVLLAEATAIDTARRVVKLTDGELSYDWLILAAGATHSYFGRDDWAGNAPGLKTVDDALEIRRRFLIAFEHAEREMDPQRRRAELTFVVIGGGPTGVELAGAMAEIAHSAIPRDFRSVDTATARIILVEAGDRILTAFPPELSHAAKSDLERLGVEVRLNARVTEVEARGVAIGAERIDAANVIWAAGVRASPIGASLGVPMDRAGRVIVNPDLTIPGHPGVFVVGDLALAADAKTGRPAPGVCPAAIQMGQYAARVIADEVRAGARFGTDGNGASRARSPFHYFDKGILATIGRNKGVASIGRLRFSGVIAWLLWALVHVMFLIGFRNRIMVMIEWAWLYFFFDRGARLITGEIEAAPGGPASPASSGTPERPADEIVG